MNERGINKLGKKAGREMKNDIWRKEDQTWIRVRWWLEES